MLVAEKDNFIIILYFVKMVTAKRFITLRTNPTLFFVEINVALRTLKRINFHLSPYWPKQPTIQPAAPAKPPTSTLVMQRPIPITVVDVTDRPVQTGKVGAR